MTKTQHGDWFAFSVSLPGRLVLAVLLYLTIPFLLLGDVIQRLRHKKTNLAALCVLLLLAPWLDEKDD